MTQKLTVINNNSRKIGNPLPRTALTKLEHVRCELARVYRHTRSGKLETQEATRLTYILNTLAKIIEASELEERVRQLEERNHIARPRR